MSEVTLDGAKPTSIHSPFSEELPSCQHVFASPSIALSAWNLARSPTTEDAAAPLSASGTDTAASADAVAPDEPGEDGRPDPPPDPAIATDGAALAFEDAEPRSSVVAATTPTPTMTPRTPTTISHLSSPPE